MEGWYMDLENSMEKRVTFLGDRVGGRINTISG